MDKTDREFLFYLHCEFLHRERSVEPYSVSTEVIRLTVSSQLNREKSHLFCLSYQIKLNLCLSDCRPIPFHLEINSGLILRV